MSQMPVGKFSRSNEGFFLPFYETEPYLNFKTLEQSQS
jgi:hypothetical protein